MELTTDWKLYNTSYMTVLDGRSSAALSTVIGQRWGDMSCWEVGSTSRYTDHETIGPATLPEWSGKQDPVALSTTLTPSSVLSVARSYRYAYEW